MLAALVRLHVLENKNNKTCNNPNNRGIVNICCITEGLLGEWHLITMKTRRNSLLLRFFVLQSVNIDGQHHVTGTEKGSAHYFYKSTQFYLLRF